MQNATYLAQVSASFVETISQSAAVPSSQLMISSMSAGSVVIAAVLQYTRADLANGAAPSTFAITLQDDPSLVAIFASSPVLSPVSQGVFTTDVVIIDDVVAADPPISNGGGGSGTGTDGVSDAGVSVTPEVTFHGPPSPDGNNRSSIQDQCLELPPPCSPLVRYFTITLPGCLAEGGWRCADDGGLWGVGLTLALTLLIVGLDG
eukprot:gene2535-3281_t